MTLELLSHFKGVQVEQLNAAIARARQDKITCIMELQLPDRSGMHILESMCNRRIDEVPNLDRLVSSSSGQVSSCWMEVHSADPVFVTLASHDVLVIVEIPDFPSAVVTSGCDNLLLGVEGHAADAFGVGVDLFAASASLVPGVVGLGEHGVRSGILWPRGVLALQLETSVSLSTCTLLLHAILDLLLDHLFVSLNGPLNLQDLLVGLVFLQLE